MLLVIDIGNTNVTLGLYEQNTLGPRWRLAIGHERTSDEYGLIMLGLFRRADVTASSVDSAAVASVVPPLTGAFVEACRQYLKFEPLVVNGDCDTGISIRCDDPSPVGTDRIVDAAAAHYLYGGPACIVDFGTATTFDAISREGEFLGGAIAPGMVISADALFKRAAKLPRVDFLRSSTAIGKNTALSLQSGLLFGYIGLVEGMVSRFRDELGPEMKVIATGGLADVIAKETEVISVIAPWLTLEGLKIIHDLNVGEDA
ncbi:MAG: type III pantothenate kinase [Acidobacteriota bacterium]